MPIRLFLLRESELTNTRAELVTHALRAGFARHGEALEVVKGDFDTVKSDTSLAVFLGFSKRRKSILQQHHNKGVRVMALDKALIREGNKSDYNRVCLDGMSPLRYLMREARDGDRWERLYQPLWPRRRNLTHEDLYYVYANNSQNVHEYAGLGDPQTLARETFAAIRRKAGERHRFVYRPKRTLEPSKDHGYKLSLHPDTIEDCLDWARGLVTYTSNCAVNAIMRGIPAVCLGPCAASPVSADSITELCKDQPYFPTDAARLAWIQNLAWCQWTDEEIEQGDMWAFIKEELRQTDWLFERDGGKGV